MKFAPDGSRGSSWPSPAGGDPAGPVPQYRGGPSRTGIRGDELRAAVSRWSKCGLTARCAAWERAPEQGDAFGAVRHVSVSAEVPGPCSDGSGFVCVLGAALGDRDGITDQVRRQARLLAVPADHSGSRDRAPAASSSSHELAI